MKSRVSLCLGAALSLFASVATAEVDWGGNTAARSITWAVTPTADEIAQVYPAEQTGDVAYVYRCGVGADGRLLDCRLDKTQGPAGPGFERAARTLLLHYRAAPATADGLRTSGAPVVISLVFQAKSRTVAAGGSAITFVLWSAGPDQEALDAAYPVDAQGLISARFACVAGADGALTDCKDLIAAPNAAHQARARSLLPLYRVPVTTDEGLRTEGLSLVVSVDLVKPGTPPPPVVSPIIPVAAPGSPIFIGGVDVGSTASRSRKITGDLPATVLQYFTADHACRPAPIEIVVSHAPEHGRLGVEDAEEWIHPARLPSADPRRGCGPTMFAGKRVVYSPEPGYTGRDRVAVSIRADGRVIEDVTDFDVRP